MEQNERTISYFAHEAEVARQERHIKRMWILCILMFLALVGSNAGWLWYESQFTEEVITQEVTQDSGDGGQNRYDGIMLGGDYYGETGDTTDG